MAQAAFRVGIDGYNLAIPRGTGVATYARALAACLRRLGHPIDVLYGLDIDPAATAMEREVAFFEQQATERGFRRPAFPSLGWARTMAGAWRGATAIPVVPTGLVDPRPVADRLPEHDRLLNVRHLFGVSAQYFRNFGRFMTVRVPDPPALMHWTYPVPVRLAGARNVYTVHDLVPLRMPYATLDHKPTYTRLIATCLARGDAVCTVSDRSRDDILEFFPAADPARVVNTYQSVPAAAMPAAMPPGAAARLLHDGFGLQPGGYFIFFGSIEPKKNVARLLEGFLAADIPIPLVVVSARSWGPGPEAELLKQGTAGGRLRHIEYVPADTLRTLVAGARAVAFPSLYEGFGLPVLEAMGAGTPVLTTREGSLPEVAGDAALFVDAYDPAAIGAGLARLASDDALCADLRARGPVQAARFGMGPYVDRVRAFYNGVMAGPAR